MKRNKRISGVKTIAIALILALTLSVAGPLALFTEAASTETDWRDKSVTPVTVTEFKNSELPSCPVQITYKVDGRNITMEADYPEGKKLGMHPLIKSSEPLKYDYVIGSFSNGKGSVTLTLPEIEEYTDPPFRLNSYIAAAYTYTTGERLPPRNSYWSGGILLPDMQSKGYSFYFVNGQSELDFYNGLSQYNPGDYDGIPSRYQDLKHLNDIMVLAKDITKDCTSTADKVKSIHDWLTTNISYDHPAYESMDSQLLHNAADPDLIYEKHLAVCSGYSRMARIMFGALGIPCLNIHGVVDSSLSLDILKAGRLYSSFGKYFESPIIKHEWNAVYIDNQWYAFDFTWDSQNIYYGENSEKNRTGRLPIYGYYAVNPMILSNDHVSLSVTAYRDYDAKQERPSLAATKITIPKKTYTVTAKSLRRKTRSILPVVETNGGQEVTLTLKKYSNTKSKNALNFKGNKIVVKKKTPKGKYSLILRATVEQTSEYEGATKDFKITIHVK